MKYTKDEEYITPAGNKIKKNDFKPVYQALQKTLNFTIDDVTDYNNDANKTFKADWDTKQYADLACGNVVDIVASSVKGTAETILDLKPYLDKMPNFSKFLNENKIVLKSIETAKHSKNSETAIYYVPYFDGFADLEKMTLVRADFIRKILDAPIDSVEWDTKSTIWTGPSSYSPIQGDTGYEVTVPESMTSNGTKKIAKKAVKNIITRQNELGQDQRTSQVMVKQFRDYITERYGTQYSTLSDLFLGTDASYDADEMVALMRIVRVSPKALTGNENCEMVPLLPRENNNQRIADLIRWAGQLFGVRGVESRCGYLYIDKDGKINDARGDKTLADMIDRLNDLYSEKLILQNFENKENYGTTNGKFAENIVVGGNANYCGFMEYDYSQTQGVWNDKEGSKIIEGYDFRPILGAVADWDDGIANNRIHFTESWRSVKTQAWCLNAKLAENEDKLNRALALADYFYSDEGHELNSYGPASEGYTDGTIDYQGKKVAKMSAKSLAQLNNANIGKGSYTNYLREYVGATLPVGYVKEQGMEYQCTSENAKNGLSIINHAIEVGTYKHVECAITENPFYTISPSSYFLTSGNSTIITGLEDKAKLGLIHSNSSTTDYCLLDNYIMYGFGGKKGEETLLTKEQYLKQINETWELDKLEKIYNDAYAIMMA